MRFTAASALFIILLGLALTVAAAGSRADAGARSVTNEEMTATLLRTSISPPEPMPAALRPRFTPAEMQAALPTPRSESATARTQRTDSGTAFSDLSAAEAIGVLRSAVPEIVDRTAWHGPTAPADARSVHYENDERSASIESGTGEHLLLSSPLPLRVQNEDTGQLAAVDLGLKRGAGGFRTINSFVDVTFPDDLSQGLQVGSLRLHVGETAGPASTASQIGDTVAWTNALIDTDVIADAVPQGAELTATLRSAESPEDIPVALDLPAGLTVRPSAFDDANPGGLAIVDREQRTAGTISAPVAWDADHTTVQSEWRQTGDRLMLHTSHAGKDLRYPIVVDPIINYGLSDADLAGAAGRGYPWAREDDTAARIDPFYGTSGWGTGLYQRIILPAGATRHYDVPAGAFWYLSLAGRQANIRSLQVANMRQDQGVGAGNNVLGSCTFMRVLTPNGAADFGGQLFQCGTYSGFSTNLGSGASPGTTGNTAQIGMLPSQTGDYHYFQQFIGALGVILEDTSVRTAPTISGGAPTWTNVTSVPITITAANAGLGVRAVGVASDGGTNFSWQAADPSDPSCVVCPTSVTQTMNVTGLPDGSRTLRASTQDQWLTTGPSSPSVPARLDTVAPIIGTPSGALYEDRATTFSGIRSIRVPLSGEGSTTTLDQRRSGVRQIRLIVDRTSSGGGIVADHKEFPQADSFVPGNAGDKNVLHLDASTLTPGTHTINVDAGDWANNTRLLSSFTIKTTSAEVAPGFRPGTTLLSSTGGIVNPNSLFTSGVVAVDTFRGRLLAHEVDGSIVADATGNTVWPIDRWYDSGATTLQRDLSPGWSTGVGGDVQLEFAADGTVTYVAPSQARYAFTPQVTGGYALQPISDDDDAELVQRGDGGYDVTLNNTNRVLHFDTNGRLTAADDDSGHTAHYTYAASSGYARLDTVSDGAGHVWHLSASSGVFNSVTDPASNVGPYTYTSGRLTASTTPAGFHRTYGYDTAGRLNSLTNPTRTVSVTYRSDGRVGTFGQGSTILTLSYPAVSSATCGSATNQTNITWPDGSLEAQCFDAAGNMTSRSFPDTLAPTLSTPSFEAVYDSTTARTLVQWADASDPLLIDGTPGSGITSYSVRVRRDGGAWSSPTAVAQSQLLLSGGHVGESIQTQVSYADQAGNVGTMASGTVASTAFSTASGSIACQPTETGYSATCKDPAGDSADDDVETDTDTGFVDDGAGSSLASSPNCLSGGLCRLSVSHAGWAILRNRPQEYAVGNAHNGWAFSVARTVQAQFPSKGQPGLYGGGYVQGSGGFTACAFIRNTASSTTPGIVYGPLSVTCPPGFGAGTSTINPDFRTGPDLSLWAAGVNCQHPETPNCADGYAVHLVHPATLYRNLSPYPLTAATKRRGIDAASDLDTGSKVYWRYTTSDRNWVMVRHGARSHGRTNWFFVSRYSLPPLCVHRDCSPHEES